MDDNEIVAYECTDCEVALELNARDGYGAIIQRIKPERCPLCGNENLIPITQKMYLEKYEVESL